MGQEVGVRKTYVEGRNKVSGKAKYTIDLELPGMLVGKFLYSEYPRAKVLRIDTSAAEAIPGVVAVATYKDVPGRNIFGYVIPDQPYYAEDEVRYIGEIVAAVAAENEDIAEEALEAIVVEYEPLEGVFDPVKTISIPTPISSMATRMPGLPKRMSSWSTPSTTGRMSTCSWSRKAALPTGTVKT